MPQDNDKRFSTRETFTLPKETFLFKLESVDSIKNDCIYILDTNVLLLPFKTDKQSLSVIKEVYQKLVEENRLFIPSHVIREFLDNRTQKIADIKKTLSDRRSIEPPTLPSHPLLKEIPEYQEAEEKAKELKQAIVSFQDKIGGVINKIDSWNWNDPVTLMYQEVFINSILDDSHIDEAEISKDLERRNNLNIPPGFKDKSKSENKAGDILIWHEILNKGKVDKKHLIFVSGDEKPDWWHKSVGQSLYPRIELVDEYRRASGGKSFHMISLSDLLKLKKAEPKAIKAIESSEAEEKFEIKENVSSELAKRALKLSHEIRFWLLNKQEDHNRILDMIRGSTNNSISADERQSNWLAATENSINFSAKLLSEYNMKFKVDAMILKDKLNVLLPSELASNRSSHNFKYEHPANSLIIGDVADDLEYLAKSVI